MIIDLSKLFEIIVYNVADNSKSNFLEVTTAIVGILQGIFTILAIIVGGLLYFTRRKRFPKLKISHKIDDEIISQNKILLRVEVNIVNSGEVLIIVEEMNVWIQQTLPFPSDLLDKINKDELCYEKEQTEFAWKVICDAELPQSQKKEIEPGEEDDLYFDFLVDSSVKAIIVNSHVKNKSKKKKEIGWNKSTLYNLTSKNNLEGGTKMSEHKNPRQDATKQGIAKIKPGKDDRQGAAKVKPQPKDPPPKTEKK